MNFQLGCPCPRRREAVALACAAWSLGWTAWTASAGDPPRQPPRFLNAEDPLYQDLLRLGAEGALELSGLHVWPLEHHRLAQALQKAAPASPAAWRARQEVSGALADLDRPGALAPQPLIQAVSTDARLEVESFVRLQSEASPGRGFVYTDSTRFGLRFGVDLFPGLRFFQELYVADIDGARRYADPIINDTNIVIFEDRTYAALATRYATFVFGRDRLGLGPGQTGKLLLSPDAEPFTHLRYAGSFLNGRFHAVVINGVLSLPEERYVAYHRADWQVTRGLRVGAAEAARYDSRGFEPLYLLGIIPYPFVQRLEEHDATTRATEGAVRNNIMWSFDASFRPRPGLEGYAEVLIDDLGTSASQIPTRIGYQFGGRWLTDWAGRRLWLSGEWTRIWRFVYSVFYGRDFVHDSAPLGYPLGPDSRHLMGAAELELSRQWALGGRVELQHRGEGRIGDFWDPADPAMQGASPSRFAGVVERQWKALATARLYDSYPLQGILELGVARVQNAGHVRGKTETGILGRVSIALRH